MKYLLCILSLNILHIVYSKIEPYIDPANIIAERGYPVERHVVQTEDGYLLAVQRIPHGINNKTTNKRPILLNHGLSASGADFITLTPKRSIGYILADHGYDVWLMNARGTTFSNRHVRISEKNKKEFYNFSWHEIGYYDMPALIDYILNKTNQTQMQYFGHSQGGTAFLVMAATRPEYNSKISLATLIGATSVIKHMHPIMQIISPYVDLIKGLVETLEIYDSPHIELARVLLQSLCINKKNYLCTVFFDLVGGFPDHDQLDQEIFDNIFKTIPSNSATKQVIHYLQCAQTGQFRQFDHGTHKNLVVYGTPTPPAYNLSLIEAPVSMYVGKNDEIMNVDDSKILKNLLPNVVNFKIVENEHWNHGDFLFGVDVMKYVFKDMLQVMSKY